MVAVPEFEMPRDLVRDVAEHAEASSARAAWMADLPLIVDDVARRWSLELGRPFQPGGAASWVAPARSATGDHLVLKVGWAHEEALHEADGLRAWGGDGTVRLLDCLVVGENCLVVGETSALLFEACEPGTALSQVLPPQEQDAVVAGLLGRLWIEPPPDHPFRSLQSMCDAWADEFEERYATAAREPQLDFGIAWAVIALFRSLSTTADRSVLLCTDLHPENVLAAKREAWLVIDPKPYVGDPTYNPLQHMLNFPDRLVADPAGFAQRMADLLGLDTERLRHWLFARCVQESVDEPQLRSVAIKLAS
jgi:streptomycin 6-kinase